MHTNLSGNDWALFNIKEQKKSPFAFNHASINTMLPSGVI
jgi:hypothetical protein